MRLVATPAIEPGTYLLRIVRIEEARDRRGAPCLRWTYRMPSGGEYVEFTPMRFGPRSNTRAILEAAATGELPDEIEADVFLGRQVLATVIAHPNGDWRRRIAVVAAPDGTMERPLRGPHGRPWAEVSPEVIGASA